MGVDILRLTQLNTTTEETFPQPPFFFYSDCEWTTARAAKHEAISQIQGVNSLQFVRICTFECTVTDMKHISALISYAG